MDFGENELVLRAAAAVGGGGWILYFKFKRISNRIFAHFVGPSLVVTLTLTTPTAMC